MRVQLGTTWNYTAALILSEGRYERRERMVARERPDIEIVSSTRRWVAVTKVSDLVVRRRVA